MSNGQALVGRIQEAAGAEANRVARGGDYLCQRDVVGPQAIRVGQHL